jgi:exonuclease III
MTYNILNGGIGREQFILKVLEENQPDIIILQEVYESSPIEDFASSLGMESFLALGNSRRHLAILSRFPIVERHSYHPFPPAFKTTLYAKIAHPSGQNIHAFGIHLFPHPFIGFELWRRWETEIALRKALAFDSEPCFLAGDLNAIAPGDRPNTTSWPRLLKTIRFLQGGRLFRFAIRQVLSAGFTDCYRILHPKKQGYTLPTKSPTTRLDYIFANRIFVDHLKSCDIIHNPSETQQASDHYPLLAEFDV